MYTDSREIISAYSDLNTERSDYAEALELLPDDISDEAKEMLMRHTDWSPEQEEEWDMLKQACETGENEITDWHSGATLIPEQDFDGEYAQGLCEELGYIDPRTFPNWIEIDWKATAENIKQDYSEVTLCNDTYLVRD